jgi:DNA-binding response OmpR family regulator
VKILYVEDDLVISNLAKAIFMKTDHDLVLCPNINDAKKILDKEKMGLVILDLNFPSSSSGLEVLEHMRCKKITSPVIIYSGFIDDFKKEINHFVETGLVHGVYAKPFNHFGSIIKAIEELH